MKNFIPTAIPIYIFSIIIGLFGASQILNAGDMAANIPGFMPSAKVLTIISGTGLLLASVSFIIDRFARLAGYLLAVLLLIIVCAIHIPGAIHAETNTIRSLYLTSALKDMAIAMAAIIIGNLSRH